MRYKRMLCGLLALVIFPSTLWSQIFLSSLRSQSVREWNSAATMIDSLWIESEVGSGQATTTITAVLNPGYSYTQSSFYDGSKYIYTFTNPKALDSVEIATWFTLPTDFVAVNLGLWVDGEKQIGYLQDKALAAQQYQQIVGRRWDPALLEFSGNGSYSLRIFPAATNRPRKVSIEFRHTFDDDSAGFITASLPFVYDSATVASSYMKFERTKIGFVQATLSASDNNQYRVSIPGLGEGSFSRNKNLQIVSRNVANLGAGTVLASDPSGSSKKYAWAGWDSVKNRISVGFSYDISENDVTFEPQPKERILVFDMRTERWSWDEYYYQSGYTTTKPALSSYQDILTRAKKYAVLALGSYVDATKDFNVIIAGETNKKVFDKPVPGTAENIARAQSAIIAAGANPKASTIRALTDALAQTTSGVLLLISDLYQPPVYWSRTDTVYAKSAQGEAYDSAISAINNLVLSSGRTLFTISDDWSLNQLATSTGGYRLAGLQSSYYSILTRTEMVNGKQVIIPLLPGLFGKDNPAGFRNLSVSGLDDAVYTIDGYSYGRGWWWGGPIFMMDGIRKSTGLGKMVVPSYSSSSMVRIAGTGKSGKVTLSGKYGGLGFTKTLDLLVDYNPIISSFRPQVDKQWAFRKSEYLADNAREQTSWEQAALGIKALGKTYHIVTRQTSLLALEPGMKLWEDTLWAQQQEQVRSVKDASALLLGNGEGVNGGLNIDEFSLEQLAAGVLPVSGKRQTSPNAISVTAKGQSLKVMLPSMGGDATATIKLFDAQGRLILSRSFTSRDLVKGVVDLKPASHLARGHYSMQVTIGNQKIVVRVPIL